MAGYKSPHERQKESEADALENLRIAAERAADRAARLDSWRLQKFEDQGFTDAQGETLSNWKVDHHATKKMLAQGATHAQILTIFYPDALPSSEEATT